ncbi:MAG: phosphoenolpyruvate synthase [Patescibacteria group bacterium]
MPNIKWFKEIRIKDVPSVGGKNASLGEMYSQLTKKGIKIPNGFAVTAEAYRHFLKQNKLDKKIYQILRGLNVKDVHKLAQVGQQIRVMIITSKIPEKVQKDILTAYNQLNNKSFADVAVRSSATAEDLPTASFAGQQESYLNVQGEEGLLIAVKKCYASLFTNRAIAYRVHQGFKHEKVALSVGVQKMVRSDKASSGVMFTLDTESGFEGVVLVNGSWGLGENIVKGRVNPDQFFVFKKTLEQGFPSIISRRLGSKEKKLIYAAANHTIQKIVSSQDRQRFCLTDKEVIQLAKWAMTIEKHYGHPQDIEWAKDGLTSEIYIVQSRPETIHRKANHTIEEYQLKHRGKILVEGLAVGEKIGAGKARVMLNPKEMKKFKHGEVLVTRITDPDWEPLMRIASAIVTEQGGKTSHAAIVSRELGVTCVVGTGNATRVIKTGQPITVSSAEGEHGFVYQGILPFNIKKTELKKLKPIKTKIMMNVGEPDSAFKFSFLPNDGVGLAREEFIFLTYIKLHPLALINYKNQPAKIKHEIDKLTIGYKDKKQYLVDRLAEGIAMIGAAFYPKPVIVRFSDFKTNEYAALVGGAQYEPKEENPMLGWRGASRYYDPKFKPAFMLECAAIRKVREEWGLKNVIVMVPFCRTIKEGEAVLKVMAEAGLKRGKDGLQVYVMVEIPSNVILAKEFAQIFDGFSIGSNDLTQLTLGVDRDSSLVAHIYDERNEAVKILLRQVIAVAHKEKIKVGICGQAPSDYPDFAKFLVKEGIDSLSLNPDMVVKTRKMLEGIK